MTQEYDYTLNDYLWEELNSKVYTTNIQTKKK